MKYAITYNQTQISCGNYKDIKTSKIKQRTMKNQKTKSYQNKNLKIAQNRHEPIQTLGKRPYQKHTRKRKTSNYCMIRFSERVKQTPTSSLRIT